MIATETVLIILFMPCISSTGLMRNLSSAPNYRSFNMPSDVRLDMLGYFDTMKDLKDIAFVDSSFNQCYKERMEQIFGSMNQLLLKHNIDQCDSNCDQEQEYLRRKLQQITTFNNIFVNISSLTNNLDKTQSLIKNQFLRGIDTSSNLPFLLFSLVKCQFWDSNYDVLETLVFVVFNSTDIDHIIYSSKSALRYSGNKWWRRIKYIHSNDINNHNIIRMDDIIFLLKNDIVYNVMDDVLYDICGKNQSDSTWHHINKRTSLYARHHNLNFLFATLGVCLGLVVVTALAVCLGYGFWDILHKT